MNRVLQPRPLVVLGLNVWIRVLGFRMRTSILRTTVSHYVGCSGNSCVSRIAKWESGACGATMWVECKAPTHHHSNEAPRHHSTEAPERHSNEASKHKRKEAPKYHRNKETKQHSTTAQKHLGGSGDEAGDGAGVMRQTAVHAGVFAMKSRRGQAELHLGGSGDDAGDDKAQKHLGGGAFSSSLLSFQVLEGP